MQMYLPSKNHSCLNKNSWLTGSKFWHDNRGKHSGLQQEGSAWEHWKYIRLTETNTKKGLSDSCKKKWEENGNGNM